MRTKTQRMPTALGHRPICSLISQANRKTHYGTAAAARARPGLGTVRLPVAPGGGPGARWRTAAAASAAGIPGVGGQHHMMII